MLYFNGVIMKSKFFYKEFYKRNLPHYQPENGVFFITTCLANSLPPKKLKEIKEKKNDFEQMLKQVSKSQKIIVLQEFHNRYFKDFDDFLDSQRNNCWLSQADLRNIIIENLFYWNNLKYYLFAFCIMPNHVHIILKPKLKSSCSYESLSDIMFSMKSYTANECNKILDRNGSFWLHESYDHYIRNADEFDYYVDYVQQNPVKAGLIKKWSDWKGNWIAENYLTYLNLPG
ncbi:MAG: transposase [Candidatus Cloacimonadales bacterium]|nr:transposase [Candidatus Cloacimonadales bacterium]